MNMSGLSDEEISSRVNAYIKRSMEDLAEAKKLPDPNLLTFAHDEQRVIAYKHKMWTTLIMRSIAAIATVVTGTGLGSVILNAIIG